MNKYPPHVVQSPEWGEFKTTMGTEAVRVGNIQYTLHNIPFTKLKVGYCPKPNTEEINLEKLAESGMKHNCTHIKIDVPNTNSDYRLDSFPGHLRHVKPTFAKATFMLDLTKTEEELLANMHQKTRYNVHLAERRGVLVEESDDVSIFTSLQKETAQRQHFFVHPDKYYQTLWELLHPKQMAYLLNAKVNGEVNAAYFLLKYNDTFYYTYGASTTKDASYMASNLLMWEAIKFGKKLGCKQFDMWGALSKPVDTTNAWYGFHRFKEGYGGEHLEYPGAWDLIIKPTEYQLFQVADTVRWKILRR